LVQILSGFSFSPKLAFFQCNPGVPELHAILSIAGRLHDRLPVCQGKELQRLRAQHCVTRVWDENTKTLYSALYSNSTAFLSRIPMFSSALFPSSSQKGKKIRNGYAPV
jgi:hypothetical protein